MSNLLNKIGDVVIGSAGITAVNVQDTIADTVTKGGSNDIIEAIISVIIAIVTLFGLFKKRKKEKESK